MLLLKRKRILTIFIVVLILFVTLIIYLTYSINVYNSITELAQGKEKKKTGAAATVISEIEDIIKWKAFNLPSQYNINNETTKVHLSNFLNNLKNVENNVVQDVKKLWHEIDELILSDQYVADNYTNAGNMLSVLKSAPIYFADTYSRGTQLKLLLHFNKEDGNLAIFKPQWYNRNKVITGPVYAGKDRSSAEVLAYYLSALLLRFQFAPLSVERVLDIEHDLIPIASARLNATIFRLDDGRHCLFGKCYYCKREEPVCARNEDGKLPGALIYRIPAGGGKFQTYRSPWQRTYKQGKKAEWQLNLNYCQIVKSKISVEHLLDLIDVSIFDFLIQNGDRHHYEMFNNHILVLDNGKGLGNPFVHHLDILAPFYQCCIIRLETYRRLMLFAGAPLLMELLQSIEELKRIVAAQHFIAIQKRLLHVYATIEFCKERKQLVYY